jgi:fumarate hydratase class II
MAGDLLPPVDGPGAPEMRDEADSFGTIAVPAARLWGAQTQRALEHFRISGEAMPEELVLALAAIKHAAALANRDLGLLDPATAGAIARAAQEVGDGRHRGEFPLVVWQTGSGTQTNMNLNEVLANRASELLGGARGTARLVHANDEVNLGQSSNDVFPSAMHVAAALALERRLLPALAELRAALAAKAAAFADIVKIGRTHLQDATPLTLGQEFSGYAAQLAHAQAALGALLPPLHDLAIGGTAVGTGLNTHPGFGARVAAALAARYALPFRRADNPFAALAGHDALVSAHGALKTLATALMKIANDLRWLASGPRCGLGELVLPANEPGSSIMPGKVNPTQCEALAMACCQVLGNDVVIGVAGSQGAFELNAYKPVIANAFLQSARLLADGMASFTVHCVRGIAADRERIAELLERSLMLVTALVPHLGYDRAAAIARHAQAGRMTLRAAALASGQVTAEQFDAWVRPREMIGGGGDR